MNREVIEGLQRAEAETTLVKVEQFVEDTISQIADDGTEFTPVDRVLSICEALKRQHYSATSPIIAAVAIEMLARERGIVT